MENTLSQTNQSTSILSYLQSILIVLILLWNWDGFWQTKIKILTMLQAKFFTEKYISENLKIENVNSNRFFIENLLARSNIEKTNIQRKLELTNDKLMETKREFFDYKNSTEDFAAEINSKCRHYQTSLMIISNLKKRYSEEIKESITCTNLECEDILNGKISPRTACTK